jgi:hypothetical protein
MAHLQIPLDITKLPSNYRFANAEVLGHLLHCQAPFLALGTKFASFGIVLLIMRETQVHMVFTE